MLRGRALEGFIPEARNLVLQPLQALSLLSSERDEHLARLLLIRLAQRTTLESRWLRWSELIQDAELLALAPEATWNRLQAALHDAKVLVRNERLLWSLSFPIVGEALRIDGDLEFDRHASAARELAGAPGT